MKVEIKSGFGSASDGAGGALTEVRELQHAERHRHEAVHVCICPSRGWAAIDLRELWQYRELLVALAGRDIKVRYKQTILGVAWAVLVPFMTMVVFNVLFGLLMGGGNRPTIPGVPYAVSTFCALVPWQLFASAMGQSSTSIVANRNLITKVYFPRLVAPLAPILAALVDFLLAFLMLVGMIAAYAVFGEYHFVLSWAILTLPLFVLLAVLAAFGAALWFSALNAIYRDVQYTIPFLTQLLMFITPVIYTTGSIMSDTTPLWVRVVYSLNPMAGVVEGFRWALLASGTSPGLGVVVSSLAVLGLVVSGLYYFRRMERLFADVV
jgi:lipopolysaccharide transport system permease protein